MTQVGKAELIPLTYQLADGAGAPTRYVQAVLIKASDRSTLATVNLTDNGEGDFSKYTKTPLSLSLSNGEYFEVIMTVYTDALYTQKDNSRYATTKNVFVVKESTSGIIMGNGLRSAGPGINIAELAEELVKRIFGFDKWEEIKGIKTFAKKFIALTEKSSSKDIKDMLSEIKRIMKESNDSLTKTIEQLAELVREQGKAIISDLSKGFAEMKQEDDSEEKNEIWAGFESRIEEYRGILDSINSKIDELNNKGINLSSIENALKEINQKLAIRIQEEDNKNIRETLTGLEIDVAEILNKIT